METEERENIHVLDIHPRLSENVSLKGFLKKQDSQPKPNYCSSMDRKKKAANEEKYFAFINTWL